MSGEELAVRTEPNGVLARCLRVIDSLPRRPEQPFVLIGGIAVIVRLGRAHRVTADIDTLATDGLMDATIALLGERRTTKERTNTLLVDQVTVDFVPVDTGWVNPRAAPLERAWHTGRRYAFDNATEPTIALNGVDGQTISRQRVRLATAGGLVYLKAVAMMRRRPDRFTKKASDILDIVRLVGAYPLDRLRDELVGAPELEWFQSTLDKAFRTDARYTLARLARSLDPFALPTADDLDRVAALSDLLP